MLPSIFGENLFDDWFESPIEKTFFGERNPLYGKHAKNLMKTDVRETDSSYELAIDLPGFKKEDIQAQLKNGYLTISASKGLDKDETDKEGRYIRHSVTPASAAAPSMWGTASPKKRSAPNLRTAS